MHKPGKNHLFDSFEGYPQVDRESDKNSHINDLKHLGRGKMFREKDPKVVAVLVAKDTRNILGNERVVTHVGYFKNSLKRPTADLRFAFVHIDCDLYTSAKETLAYLFGENRMANGAVILFGDTRSHKQSSPNKEYRLAWRETIEEHHVKFSDCGKIAGWGRNFIIHNE